MAICERSRRQRSSRQRPRPASCLGLLALLLAVAGCRQAPSAPQPTPQRAATVPGATNLSPGDPRMLRFHKVDMLVAQWDVAQAGGRTDQADALASQIRSEVDTAFPDFVTASRGVMDPPRASSSAWSLASKRRPLRRTSCRSFERRAAR